MYTQNNIIKYALQTDHTFTDNTSFPEQTYWLRTTPEEQNNTLLNLHEHSLVCALPTAQVSKNISECSRLLSKVAFAVNTNPCHYLYTTT